MRNEAGAGGQSADDGPRPTRMDLLLSTRYPHHSALIHIDFNKIILNSKLATPVDH